MPDFVFVTVEEVELSLSSVVALADKSEEDDDGLVLEARVRATQEVANVHELALLQRASMARRLSRQLSDVPDDAADDVASDDARRRTELEHVLLAAADGPAALLRSSSKRDDDALRQMAEIGALQDAADVTRYLRARGRGIALKGCERRLRCAAEAGDESPSFSAPPPKDSEKDLSEAQARKDIERDSLVIRSTSNEALSCSAETYEHVVASIADAQKSLVRRADASEWRPVDDADLRALAKAALRAVNRTESGGLALETLAELLPPCLTPVPDSKRAEPLRIDLSLGPARDPTTAPAYQWRWGLRANVEGSTSYRLFPSDSDFDRGPLAFARATYANQLLLPLDALDKTAGREPHILYDRRKATVAVHISLADDDDDGGP